MKTQEKHYKIEFENSKGEKQKYALKEIKHLVWTNFHKVVNIVISSPDGCRRFIWPIDKIFINDKCLSKCSVVKYL